MSESKKKQIGTHSGSFHCDEALACYLLTNHTAEWKDAEIIRKHYSLYIYIYNPPCCCLEYKIMFNLNV